MKKVAFKGGLLIDGTGAEPVVNSLVLTEDDKIAYAGADKEIGPDYEVVDITGKTIMPGLIDSHLHFSGNLTDDDSDWVLEDVVQKTVVAVQQAHECLENGLTTVGDFPFRHPNPQHGGSRRHEGPQGSGNRTWILPYLRTRGFPQASQLLQRRIPSMG